MEKRKPKKVTSGQRLISLGNGIAVEVPYPIDRYGVKMIYIGGDDQKPVKETNFFDRILN